MKLIHIDKSNAEKYFNEDRKREFDRIYRRCFPVDDEREDFFRIIFPRVIIGSENLHTEIIVAEDFGSIIGAGIIDIYSGGYEHLIYLFVSENFRGIGIGTKICRKCLSLSPKDRLFVEIENPDKVQPPEVDLHELSKRLNFYKPFNLKLLVKDYIQPALSSEQNPVGNLSLYSIGTKQNGNDVSGFLLKFYEMYYGELDQEKLNLINNMLNSNNKTPNATVMELMRQVSVLEKQVGDLKCLIAKEQQKAKEQIEKEYGYVGKFVRFSTDASILYMYVRDQSNNENVKTVRGYAFGWFGKPEDDTNFHWYTNYGYTFDDNDDVEVITGFDFYNKFIERVDGKPILDLYKDTMSGKNENLSDGW